MRPDRLKRINYFVGKIDYHLHKNGHKVGNWWEDCSSQMSRRTLKQILKSRYLKEMNMQFDGLHHFIKI